MAELEEKEGKKKLTPGGAAVTGVAALAAGGLAGNAFANTRVANVVDEMAKNPHGKLAEEMGDISKHRDFAFANEVAGNPATAGSRWKGTKAKPAMSATEVIGDVNREAEEDIEWLKREHRAKMVGGESNLARIEGAKRTALVDAREELLNTQLDAHTTVQDLIDERKRLKRQVLSDIEDARTSGKPAEEIATDIKKLREEYINQRNALIEPVKEPLQEAMATRAADVRQAAFEADVAVERAKSSLKPKKVAKLEKELAHDIGEVEKGAQKIRAAKIKELLKRLTLKGKLNTLSTGEKVAGGAIALGTVAAVYLGVKHVAGHREKSYVDAEDNRRLTAPAGLSV